MIESLQEDVTRIEQAMKKLKAIRECMINSEDCFRVLLNYNSGAFGVNIMINRLHLDFDDIELQEAPELHYQPLVDHAGRPCLEYEPTKSYEVLFDRLESVFFKKKISANEKRD